MCICVCVGTWPCSAATFRTQLWLYPLTQNTDNMSNLFPLSGNLPCLWKPLWYPENGRQPASANPDNITRAKNTFSKDTDCTLKHLEWTILLPAQEVKYTFQTTYKPLCFTLRYQQAITFSICHLKRSVCAYLQQYCVISFPLSSVLIYIVFLVFWKFMPTYLTSRQWYNDIKSSITNYTMNNTQYVLSCSERDFFKLA